MSFNSDTTIYEFTRERLQVITASDIISKIKKLLVYETKQLQKSKKIMNHQINKHRKNVDYEIGD